MDIHSTRKSSVSSSANNNNNNNNRASCSVPNELGREAKPSPYQKRFGLPRITAARPKHVPDREIGETSKVSERAGSSSSSRYISRKSTSSVSSAGSSSSSITSKRTRKMRLDSSNQPSSSQTASMEFSQTGQVGSSLFKNKVRCRSISGQAESANLATSSKEIAHEVGFVRGTAAAATSSRNDVHYESSSVKEHGNNLLSKFVSTGDLDSIVSNDQLYKDQEHILAKPDENETEGLEADVRLRPVIVSTDMGSSSINCANPYSSAVPNPEEYFDMDVSTGSDSSLHCNHFLNHTPQVHGRPSRRISLGNRDTSSARLDDDVNNSFINVATQRGSPSKNTVPDLTGIDEEFVSLSSATPFLDHADVSPIRLDNAMNSYRLVSTGSVLPVRDTVPDFLVSSTSSQLVTNEAHISQLCNVTSRHHDNGFAYGLSPDAVPLSSVSSSSQEHVIDQTGNRRVSQTRSLTDNHLTMRRNPSKLPVASHTAASSSSHRSNRTPGEVGLRATGTTRTHTNAAASRRTIRATHPSTWCASGISGEEIVESRRTAESSSSHRNLPMLGQVGQNSKREEIIALGGSMRSRNRSGGVLRLDEGSHGDSSTSGQRTSRIVSGSTRRGGVQNGFSGGQIHESSRFSRRLVNPFTEPYVSCYDLRSEDDIVNYAHVGSSEAATPRGLQMLSALASSNQRHRNSRRLATSSPFVGSSNPVPNLFPSSRSVSPASSETSSLSSLFDGFENVRSREAAEDTLGLPILLHSEGSGHRAFHALSIDGDSQTRFTIAGLEEILLALEHIQQDQELTYEQVLMLEANLFSGGLSFHDQHSDMRLDIDNMSYEELLALEERIGSVSTGLSEDAISKCLSKSSYVSNVSTIHLGSQESEVKCCICQEEYQDNDELGRLKCEHSYHTDCIRQWLLQKNQCPICKAAAA